MMDTLLWIVIAVAACGHRGQDMQPAADQANAAIVAMRPSVAVVTSPSTDDTHVVDACKQAIAQIQPLPYLELGDLETGSDAHLSVEELARFLQSERDIQCAPDEGDGRRTARCVSWCRRGLGQLIEAVDRARQKLAAKGVSLQSLR